MYCSLVMPDELNIMLSEVVVGQSWLPFTKSLTNWLTGAGSRRLEGTNIGHENAEGMAYVGVRVEPTVRLGHVGRV